MQVYGDALPSRCPTSTAPIYLLVLGANPAASNGSMMALGDARGALARHPRARRARRGHRPAPHRDGRRGARAPLHPPRAATRRCSSRCCTSSSPRASSTRRASPASRSGLRRSARSPRVSRPSASRRRSASTPRRSARSPAISPARRAPRLRARRRLPERVRPGRLVARRGAQRRHGQLRSRGRRDVPRRPPPTSPARRASLIGNHWGRWRSRVRGLPEFLGALPSAVMAEEMETPGDGQIRALVCFAGNPVLLDAERRAPRARAREARLRRRRSTST